MTDTELSRRREIRKRKILENAEIRKQKIFGLYSNTDDISLKNSDDVDETGSTVSHQSELSSNSLNNENSVNYMDNVNISEILRNIPDPLLSSVEETLNTDNNQPHTPDIDLNDGEADKINLKQFSETNVKADNVKSSPLITPSFYSSGIGNTSNRTFTEQTPSCFRYLEHPAAPLFLALVVVLLLSVDLGNVVSNSYIVPFCLWEFQQIIALYTSPETMEQHQTSIFEAALLLCGINTNVTKKYMWILKLLMDILEDFTLYIMTIVLVQFVTGLPAIGASE